MFFFVAYDKGWSAAVNGQPAQTIKAEYGFMAVKVPDWENYIEFTYNPVAFKTGMPVSLISTELVAAYTLTSIKRQKF